jgi:putative transposase
MRQARLKLDSGVGAAYYHCLSRVVERRFAFGPNEKEQFVHWMQAYAGFCGVRVLTYCIMSNHFHILVEVSQRPEVLPGDTELLQRHALVHGDEAAESQRKLMMSWPEEQRQQWRNGLYAQMWDLSAYLKLLKQRFTQWFNRWHRRKGTLWEERFKSVLVEGSRESLARVAAYIDLNPIRARLVEDPQDYRWSGYAAAVAGLRVAREGIGAMIHLTAGGEGTLTEAMAIYRTWVFGEGMTEGVQAPDGPTIRAGISPEKVREVFAQKGKLGWGDYVRCRVRYFTDGAVIGSRGWVNQVFEDHRQRFGPKRKDGARRFRFLVEADIFGLRDLRLEPVAVDSDSGGNG